MHKVSVIIPAYNCQDYIQTTIDSVINQTYPNEYLEVIIVNDGSTDNTAKIIDVYKNDFKIIHTTNRGVSYARNEGLKPATGDFIQYLDSDDILMPNKIEQQVKALVENKGDVAYGNWQKFVETEDSIKITETVERQIEGDQEIALFTDFWCPPAAILYSKNIVDKIGPWKQWLPIIQDARYFLDAALNDGKFVYTNSIVAQYREGNPNSLSKQLKQFSIDCLKNCIDILHRYNIKELHNDSLRHDAIRTCLLNNITGLRKYDSIYYQYAINILLRIDPNFIPRHKGVLKTMSILMGYRNAEFFARLKSLVI